MIIEPTPPRLLYKYRQIDCKNTESMLSKGEVFFAAAEILNDPCENFFMFTEENDYKLSDKEVEELILPNRYIKTSDKTGNLCLLPPEYITKYFMNSIKKNNKIGILSLSSSDNIMQMYAYYADGSKGICIGFEWNSFELMFNGSHPPLPNMPKKINYVSVPLMIKRFASADDWVNVFTTKGNGFSFEEEWRMFHIRGAFSSDKVRQAIRSITFGPHFFNQKQDKWKVKLKKVVNLTRGLNIKWYKTEPILGEYKLEVTPLDCHDYLS